MDDIITLDLLGTNPEHNLSEMIEDNDPDDQTESLYSAINHSCNYYDEHETHNIISKTSETKLSLFCLNTQGLRAHWDGFSSLINNVNSESYCKSFDVIGITELFSMSPNECDLDGYHQIAYKTRNDV